MLILFRQRNHRRIPEQITVKLVHANYVFFPVFLLRKFASNGNVENPFCNALFSHGLKIGKDFFIKLRKRINRTPTRFQTRDF